MKTPQKALEPLGIKKLSKTEMQFMEMVTYYRNDEHGGQKPRYD